MEDESFEDKIPDQFLFEPEDIEPSKKRRFLQLFAGLIFIIAILYFGGFYQYFFFSRTPDRALPSEHQQIVEGEKISVPTNFYIVGGTNRDDRNIENLAEKASGILIQAGISIDIYGVERIESGEGNIFNALDDEDFLNNLPNYNPQTVTVILSRSLLGLNGVAFGSGGVIAVAEYTAGYDFRTLAHEMGHILGLGHTQDSSRLMNSGGRGEKLTVEETEIMRQTALQFGGSMLK